jgi:hypothetical protein
MKNKALKIVAAVAVIVLVCVGAFPKPQQNVRAATKRVNSPVLSTSTPISTPKGASSSAKNAFGKLPLRFEKNQGQSDPQVQYVAKGAGYTLFLTSTEAVFRLNPPRSNPLKARQVGRNRPRKIRVGQVKQAPLVRMRLSGANVTPKIEAANLLPGTVNYLVGNDPKKWHTKVPTYGTVQFSGVYPGIDLVYYGNQRKLEYDFVVNPGGDPKKIAFEFDGATGVALSPAGDLKMDSAAGKLTAKKPAVYQAQGGQRKPVDGKFVRREGNKIGVELGNYDPTKPLVIDPILDFSSYLGGSGDEEANAIAVDSQGFSYVAGDTTSVDFPTSGTSLSSAPNGTTISFVTKMNQTGTALVYSTYLGGTNTDIAMGIAVDANGQAYVDGLTSSADFPVTPANAFQSSYGTGANFNAFLAKLSADGQSLMYSTFLGGTVDDEGTGIAIDANQNAYLTGYASSSNFPTTAANAFQSTLNSANGNAFVARIDTTRSGASSLMYSTFLGGTSPYSFSQLSSGSFGGDGALSIAVDANQNVFVVGEASSTDFPITSGTAFQTTGNASNSAFLTRLDTNQSGANSLIYSTFLGGTGTIGDLGIGVALDLNGNTYVVGDAYSADFPLTVTGTNSANGKAFVAKFSTNLSGTASLAYSTLVGGSGGEQGEAITVDPDGDAYIGGATGSTDFSVTADAVQSTLQGTAWNGFLAVLRPDGSGPLYGTYLGGSGTGAGDKVWGLALDSHENLYIVGQTDSSNFPTTPGAFQSSSNGPTDGFVAELSGIVTTPQISSVFPASGPVGSTITINGSGFGAPQGGGLVQLGTNYAFVTKWTDTQIVAMVSSASASGIAQVTQAGMASNSLSFTVAIPTITSISPANGSGGTQVIITGSGFGSTQGIGKVLLGTTYGWVTSWSATQVVATVAAGSASGTAQIVLGAASSNALNFSVTMPTITNVSPASGTAGTQVTITGSGFGLAQGNGKALLGTTYGTVTSWSDTQVVATVATGSSSGTAQIVQGGNSSNALNFTVAVPVITTVSPASGLAGTQVTLSGSGFGAAQANGNVWLGTVYGAVVSWSDTQVMATVASGSATGTARILQNGVWSNSLPFSTGLPQITSVSPNLGAAGTQVIITGSGFGAVQGSGSVSLGSTLGLVSSWSDTQVVATVASGAVTGVARIQQNGVSSNAVQFLVPTVGSGNNVTLSPNLLSLVVGESRSIQALQSNGTVIGGLTWTSSDPTIASLSTDDPPLITALAPGHVTVTAGDASCDITVYPAGSVLPPGTVVWSVPGGVDGIFPAVPSRSGVADVFAVTVLSVQALTSDGTMMWTAALPPSTRPDNSLLPDFQGGLVYRTDDSVTRFDGMTGQQLFQYTFNTAWDAVVDTGRLAAVHTDGTVFVADADKFLALDPSTGGTKFSFLLPHSTGTVSGTFCEGGSPSTSDLPPRLINLSIAGDGYAYLMYEYGSSTVQMLPCNATPSELQFNTLQVSVLRVGPAGDATTIPVYNWSSEDSFLPDLIFNQPITNADQGVLYSWSLGFNGAQPLQQLTTIAAGGGSSTVSSPVQDPLQPVLQLADGSYVGTTFSNISGISMMAFDATGNVRWIVPGDSPHIATADGVIIGSSGTTYDANGIATGQLSPLPIYSWTGVTYESGAGTVESFMALLLSLQQGTYCPIGGCNPSGNFTAVNQPEYPPLASCTNKMLQPPVSCPAPGDLIWNAMQDLTHQLTTDNTCSAAAQQFVFSYAQISNPSYFSRAGQISPPITPTSFASYLLDRPMFYDGTKSTLNYKDALCGEAVFRLDCGTAPGLTVKGQMNGSTTTAITITPSAPFKSFWQPQYTPPLPQELFGVGLDPHNNGVNILNESTLFHEALHGITGLYDQDMYSIFPNVSAPSENISIYIMNNILNKCPTFRTGTP